MGDRSSGTLTFLFTDIEGSTQRWQNDESAMAAALADHDLTIRTAVADHGGTVFKHTGDGLCAVFGSASAAVAAALDVQARLSLPVRMGVHTGEAEFRDGDYFGPTLNRAARVMDAGHGGQVVLSSATASLVRSHEFVDLGTYHLKGLDVVERLFQAGPGEFPALRTPRQVLGNLPVDLTTFVGRSEEVHRLVDELADHRIVTLIGVGGTGKTRLSVETGRAVSPSYPDGCWLVQLAPVSVEEAVPFAFATGLGFTAPVDRDVVDDLVTRLRHKRVLIVIDNCEHLLAATAEVVERIATACPMVGVLATSREPLMVSGERLIPVPSLPATDAERLFIERARDEAPDLIIDADQSAAISELCRRLDGLPLAIELAASRVRAFTPVELVTKLEERFRLLVGGRRSRMERHQTMRGTLDWSYDLCTETEQIVFDRLSVFPAGFDMTAARAVAGTEPVDDFDVTDSVPSLVDRSLLQRTTAVDGTTRYRMLETMRAYGREHLQHAGTSDATRARHARYFADTIGALSLRSLGPDEQAVTRRLIEYLPDALVALDWCIDQRDWEAAMAVTFVGTYSENRETNEMVARLHDAVVDSGEAPDVLVELERSDARMRELEAVTDACERGLRDIRSRRSVPRHRLSWPPQFDLEDGGFSPDIADELVASLDDLGDAPSMVRYTAEWSTIRGLAHAGFLERAEQLVPRFEMLVREMRSARAMSGLDEIRGKLAMQRHHWPEAAHWYSRVVVARADEPVTWFKLVCTWHLMTARALSDAPFEITGSDLVRPWRWYREEHLTVLSQHGAVSTAIALHRLGHDVLARRFVTWASRYNPDSWGLFVEVPEGLGLVGHDVEPPDDLDTLIDELMLFADQLGQESPGRHT